MTSDNRVELPVGTEGPKNVSAEFGCAPDALVVAAFFSRAHGFTPFLQCIISISTATDNVVRWAITGKVWSVVRGRKIAITMTLVEQY